VHRCTARCYLPAGSAGRINAGCLVLLRAEIARFTRPDGFSRSLPADSSLLL